MELLSSLSLSPGPPLPLPDCLLFIRFFANFNYRLTYFQLKLHSLKICFLGFGVLELQRRNLISVLRKNTSIATGQPPPFVSRLFIHASLRILPRGLWPCNLVLRIGAFGACVGLTLDLYILLLLYCVLDLTRLLPLLCFLWVELFLNLGYVWCLVCFFIAWNRNV